MFSTQLVHLLLLPPGLQCLLGVAALVLFWRGRRRLATGLAVLALASLYLLASPVGSGWLARSLEDRVMPLRDPGQLPAAGYQAIVVLGGGRLPQAPEYDGRDVVSAEMLVRLRYAAHVQRQSGLPLLVTGGVAEGSDRGSRPAEAELMAESLRNDFGVPVRWLEPFSRTTRENAEMSADMLHAQGITHVVLVSHAWHLRRAARVFERAGFSVLPAPTRFSADASALTFIERWTPQHDSLGMSRRALHEWLGMARDAVF